MKPIYRNPHFIFFLIIQFVVFSVDAPLSWASPVLHEVTNQYQHEISFDELETQEDVSHPSFQSHTISFLEDNPLSQVEENALIHQPIETQSDDTFYDTNNSWGNSYEDLHWLKYVDGDDAWDITKGEGSLIAVIDTGLDFNHVDIADNVWSNASELNGKDGVDDDGNDLIDDFYGWDYVNDDNDPTDDQGHGSHVAGIAAGIADNGVGIAGIAPLASVMALKVFNSSGRGSLRDAAEAIRYAADKGADVINMSFGAFAAFLSNTTKNLFSSAIDYAISKGSILVAAAGNSGLDAGNYYPAQLENVITVAASMPESESAAWFTNYGDAIDVMAPGHDILSLKASDTSFGSSSRVDDRFVRASGTSMASPLIAGVVALMKSLDKTVTYQDVLRRFQFAGLAGAGGSYGAGLVNVFDVVSQDFYEDGTLKTKWLPSPDAEGVVRYDYNLSGQVLRKEFEDGSYATVEYDETTALRSKETFYSAEGELTKTVEYYEDGETPRRVLFADGREVLYDRNGNEITPGGGNSSPYDYNSLTDLGTEISFSQEGNGVRKLQKQVQDGKTTYSLVYRLLDLANDEAVVKMELKEAVDLSGNFELALKHVGMAEADVAVRLIDASGNGASFTFSPDKDWKNFIARLSDAHNIDAGFDLSQIKNILISVDGDLTDSQLGKIDFQVVFDPTPAQEQNPIFRFIRFPFGRLITFPISRFLKSVHQQQIPVPGLSGTRHFFGVSSSGNNVSVSTGEDDKDKSERREYDEEKREEVLQSYLRTLKEGGLSSHLDWLALPQEAMSLWLIEQSLLAELEAMDASLAMEQDIEVLFQSSIPKVS